MLWLLITEYVKPWRSSIAHSTPSQDLSHPTLGITLNCQSWKALLSLPKRGKKIPSAWPVYFSRTLSFTRVASENDLCHLRLAKSVQWCNDQGLKVKTEVRSIGPICHKKGVRNTETAQNPLFLLQYNWNSLKLFVTKQAKRVSTPT